MPPEVSNRSARVLAWSLFAGFVALWLGTLALIVFGSGNADDAFVLAVCGFPLVGALVASRQPRNAVGWLLIAIGLGFALTSFVDSYVLSPSAPGLKWVAWLAGWVWYAWLYLAAIFLPLVFPDGRLLSSRWRAVIWLGAAALAASIAGSAIEPGALDTEAVPAIQNPLGVDAAADVAPVLMGVGNVLAAVSFLFAAASLVVRFRRSRGTERQQLKWFAYVGLLALAGLTLAMPAVLFGGNDGGQGSALEVIGSVGWSIALIGIVVGIPVATGLAILRHRLYDVDLVINRTLVYGALTATLVGSYLASVLLLQLALSPLTADSGLAVAGSTLAVAALFRPARARIQAVVDRRFYRRRYDAARTLEAFGVRLRDEVELDALSAELRRVVGDTMQPAYVSLWLREAER